MTKFQVPTIGGIRKVIKQDAAASPGTTIAEVGSGTISLAQLAQYITQLQTAQQNNTQGAGDDIYIVVGPGLSGGGSVGVVPIRLTAPIPYFGGEDGADGADGPPGAAGPQGATGNTGATGPAGVGVMGPAGEDGADGQDGNPGPQGNEGPQGLQGATGPPGIGVQGQAGEDGTEGDPGPPGAAGPRGATGQNGAQGAAGPALYLLEDTTNDDAFCFPLGVTASSGTTTSGNVFNVTPDTHYATPNFSADDYFETASLDTAGTRFSGAAPWTWLNQGSYTATQNNGMLVLQAPTQGVFTYNIGGIYQTMSTGSVTYVAAIEDCQFEHLPSNYSDMGIFLYETATGKAVTFYLFDYAQSCGIGVDNWASPTSHTGSIAQAGNNASLINTTVQLPANNTVGLYRRVYLRFRIASGTVFCDYSLSGAQWVNFTSFTATTYFTTAPNAIGLYISNIETGVKPTLIVDSFIETA